MLLGTTLAWFTDVAYNSGNRVQAGTLKLDLLKGIGEDNYESIDDQSGSLFESTYWQPDETRVVYLGIENLGSLDLQYYVDLIVYQPEDQSVDMTKVMQYTITPDAKYGNDVIWNSTNAKKVALGTNSSVGEAVLAADTTHYFALAVHMDETASNDYQGKEVTFDIRIRAEQINKDAASESIRIFFNGKERTYESKAIKTEDGVLMVPMTGIFTALGAEVTSEGNVYTAKRGEEIITVTMDSDKAVVSGSDMSLEAAAMLIEGVAMVPLSFVGDALDCVTEYVEARNAVMIYNTTQNVMAALKEADALCSEDVLKWLASLYDPGTGGFYYSISARDNEGFLPDLESTYQAMYLLQQGGMIGTGANEHILPLSIREGFVNFARERQDPDDGYFYDTQWGKDVTTSKRGRDYSWGKSLVTKFNGTFKYTLSEDRIQATAETAASTLSVAEVSNLDERYESKEKFLAYLNSFNWDSDNLWGVANELASQITMIQKAGLMMTAAEFIASKQNEHGLWGNGDLSLDHTNAAMKLAPFFKATETFPYPNFDKMLDSFLKVYSDIEPTYITDLWNPLNLVTQARANYGSVMSEDLQNKLDAALTQIIETCVEHAMKFKKYDGAFGYDRTKGQEYSAGVPRAKAGVNESDVNATLTACTTMRSELYKLAGLSAPPIYDVYTDSFIADLLDNEPIIKEPIILPEYIPTYNRTYDTTQIGCKETFEGIPANYFPGGPWTKSSHGVFKTAKNPDDASDITFRMVSEKPGLMWGKISNINNGSTGPAKITISMDFMLASASKDAVFYNKIGSVFEWCIIDSNPSTGKYALSYRKPNGSGVGNRIFSNAEYDKWYSLKIEYTVADHSVDFYVDNILVAEFNDVNEKDKIEYLQFLTFSSAYGDLYVDDVVLTVN